jgi:single-stranded-DNA-specific exonuclease
MIQNNSHRIEKLWLSNEIADDDIKIVSKGANVSPFLAKILLSRGMKDIDKIKEFINPSLYKLNDPFLLKDMKKAVVRIKQAIEANERIVIYGDYDVDGITSTSVMINFLSGICSNVDYYIPDRIDEGYGLSMGAIDKINQAGTALIITVDCGITAVDEVRHIKELGMDVIITDHHECKEVLPEAFAIVSPCRPDSEYPFNELAGVGVVYKLVCAMCMELGLGELHYNYLDLVALGTVADVVPLVGENRIIVKHGLRSLEKTNNTGLQVMLECCNLKDKQITSWGIGFLIAPRINAAGRVGNAGRAVELLTTSDRSTALEIATQLNEENKYRQETELEIFHEAIAKIEQDIDLEKEKVLVVAGEGWHHGVIGIVASKIVEKYYRPCILISHEDGMGKGSGRSIEGLDLFKALNYCGGLLDKFGGHELAAGLSLSMENFAAFRESINIYADEIINEEDLYPKVRIDALLDTDDINIANIRELDVLAPFGAGNPGPVFEFDGLKICDIKTLSEGKHLKTLMGNKELHVEAIGFGMGSMAQNYNRNDLVDVAGALEINTWNSIDKVQLNLRDIKPNRENSMEESFFCSLDKCMKLDVQHNKSMKTLVQYSDQEDELLFRMVEEVKSGKKVIVLVNSLIGVKTIEKKLRKYCVGIKKPYLICYTSVKHNNNYENKVLIVANPYDIDLSTFDMILFYGTWVNTMYMDFLMGSLDTGKVFFLKCEDEKFDSVCELVPERMDLVAVYQYIKANIQTGYLEENLFTLAKKISTSYKISMNYFKLKKGIEIFEELGLMQKEQFGDNAVRICITDNGKEKTNIEKSLIYRNLQALKNCFCV